ncbi:MAG: DMT family transporter [Pseudomonadales bacterium]
MPNIERKDHIDLQGASLLIGFSVLLGFNQALVKLVNAGFNPVFQAGLRSFFAFFIVLAFALAMRKRLSITDGSLGLGFLNGCLFALEFALLFLALDYTSVARLSLFFYTMPFFVALAAHFIFPGEQLTPTRIGGLLLALAGVAVALPGGGEQVGPNAWIGDLMAVGAAMCWAALTLLIRGTRLVHVSDEQNLLYQLAVSGLVLLAIAPLFGDLVRTVTPTLIGILAFQVIAVASAGFLLWIWLLQRYPVSDMASFSLLTPLFGVFSGWLIFNDKLTIAFLVALILVASGLYLMNRKPAP